MPVKWDDEPYLVMYFGKGGDYMDKQAITPYSDAQEAGYAQWKANWLALKGTRRAAYFIIPRTEAEALPAQLTKWEIEARDIGLKNGAEYGEVYNTMKKYWDIDKVTEGTRKGILITMAEIYDTYRDEVVDVGGTPDGITKFVTAIMTSPEAWAKLQAEAGPLVAQIKAERKKKKKEKRKRRLTTLVIIIAVVATIITFGGAIVSAMSSITGAGAGAGSAAGLISSVTGLSTTTAALIAAGATALVKSGVATKDQAASAAADVAIEEATAGGKKLPDTKPVVSPTTVILVAGGGIALTGLVILLIPKRK